MMGNGKWRWLAGIAMLMVSVFAWSAQHKLTKVILPGNKILRVDLALTPQQHEVGLMFRTSLPKNYGMLFVFPTEQDLQFWMKNTWVDLDMVFLDNKKKITIIHRHVPRSYPETPDSMVARREGRGQYVLELPAGTASHYDLKEGQQLTFALPSTKSPPKKVPPKKASPKKRVDRHKRIS